MTKKQARAALADAHRAVAAAMEKALGPGEQRRMGEVARAVRALVAAEIQVEAYEEHGLLPTVYKLRKQRFLEAADCASKETPDER